MAEQKKSVDKDDMDDIPNTTPKLKRRVSQASIHDQLKVCSLVSHRR